MGVWLCGFVAVFLLFQLVEIPALLFRRNDLADITWGPGFALGAWAAALFGRSGGFASLDSRGRVALTLVTIWALRLGATVAFRALGKREEDARYAKMRRSWGRGQVWRSVAQVWLLQPLFLFVILLPVLYCLDAPARPMGWLGLLGIAAWLVGFAFEAIGDEQLRRHKADPANKGRIMASGLWRFSRHPNYFGETLLWWGIWLLTAELPGSLWTVLGPCCLSFLLLRVSGVTMTEDLMKARPGYQEYIRRTSAFLPWPPKRQ